MTEHVAISREAHMFLFRALHGRDPIMLRNPFTGEIFWTETGHYRMDGQEDPRDIVGMPMQGISLAGHEDHMAQSGIRWRGV